MTRAPWLVLAACSVVLWVGCTTAPAPHTAPLKARSVPPPAAPSATTSARLAITGGARLDLIVDGADATARRQCAWLVAHPGAGIPPGSRLERACEAQALPPVPLRTALLVTEETVDANTVIVENLFEARPHPESDRYLINLHGRRLTYQPMDDLAACERVRKQLRAEQEQQEAAAEDSRLADLDRRGSDVSAEETAACKRAADAEASCETTSGDAKSSCMVDAKLPRIACDEMKRGRAQLDAERSVKPEPRVPTQRCLPPR